jgi:ATP-dependent RNA helicase RhlE
VAAPRPQRHSAPRDPFFDQPYQPATVSAAPTWEAAAKHATVRGISANIKPKRKVAALFKAAVTDTAVSA